MQTVGNKDETFTLFPFSQRNVSNAIASDISRESAERRRTVATNAINLGTLRKIATKKLTLVMFSEPSAFSPGRSTCCLSHTYIKVIWKNTMYCTCRYTIADTLFIVQSICWTLVIGSQSVDLSGSFCCVVIVLSMIAFLRFFFSAKFYPFFAQLGILLFYFVAGACYNCGKSGHIQRDCPEASSKRCYECDGDHLARDCPDRRPRGGRGSEDGAGADDRKCYNCGNTGHMQRDCPDARSNEGRDNRRGACYK